MTKASDGSEGGKFSFEAGSYGGPGVYVPSILCRKRVSSSRWRNHFVLVNPKQVLSDEESASAMAAADLDEAFEKKDQGGSEVDLAICLRGKGYMNVKDYKIVKE